VESRGVVAVPFSLLSGTRAKRAPDVSPHSVTFPCGVSLHSVIFPCPPYRLPTHAHNGASRSSGILGSLETR
jgi:hypothetical protein